jgi:hypothetical protein
MDSSNVIYDSINYFSPIATSVSLLISIITLIIALMAKSAAVQARNSIYRRNIQDELKNIMDIFHNAESFIGHKQMNAAGLILGDVNLKLDNFRITWQGRLEIAPNYSYIINQAEILIVALKQRKDNEFTADEIARFADVIQDILKKLNVAKALEAKKDT